MKLDDLTNRRSVNYPNLPVSRQWDIVLRKLQEEKIPASLGVIGESLEREDSEFQQHLKKLVASGNFSLFNHGYHNKILDRTKSGFSGPPANLQATQVKETNRLLFERIGYIATVFGPHDSGVDEGTAEALNSVRDIRHVWFYGEQLERYGWKGKNIPRLAELESPIFRPSLKSITDSFERGKLSTGNATGLQGHPDMWSDKDRLEFDLILEFLRKIECKFLLP